jgi:hypothetical protein
MAYTIKSRADMLQIRPLNNTLYMFHTSAIYLWIDKPRYVSPNYVPGQSLMEVYQGKMLGKETIRAPQRRL